MVHGSPYPGLNLALDPEGVLERLRKTLPECSEGLQLLDNSILDVRYRPGGECWILYRLKVRRGKHRSQRVLASGRMLRSNESPPQLPQDLVARFQHLRKLALRTPAIHLVDVGMVLYPYPLDASLPGLLDAVSPARMKKHLSRLWGRHGLRIVSVEAQTRGYTPHARAAFFYDVLVENKDTGEPAIRRMVGKIHAKKSAARLFGDAWALWQAGRRRISLAPPVGYIGETGLTLQERVAGERLGGLVDQPGFNRRVKITARSLAELHAQVVPLTTRRRPAEEAQSVARWSGVLAAISPETASRVHRLRDRLASAIETRACLTSPIHADFHHTNVLFHGDHITIIDLDEMAFGDPMVDVGRFMASLRVPARRAFGDITALDGAAEVFLQEYLSRSRGDEKRARLFEASALLIAAGSSFRVQRDKWEEEVGLLVEEAENKLAAAEATTVGTGDIRPAPPPREDRRRWAEDGMYMQAVLDPHVKAVYGARIHRCRPAKTHGSRIRYAVRGVSGGARWQVSLEGVLGWERGGRRFLKRLKLLREQLDSLPNSLLLPRPVAHIKPLSLLVWEVPSGTRFSSLVGTPRAHRMADTVAAALATLHGVPADFENRRPLSRELELLKKHVKRLQKLRGDLAGDVGEVWEEIDRRCGLLSDRFVPIVRTVHPHHVLEIGERPGMDKIDDLILSHPHIDVADFLARITLLGIQTEKVGETTRIAERFRETYGRLGPFPEGDLAPFESGALLRMASQETRARLETADLLVRTAKERLAA